MITRNSAGAQCRDVDRLLGAFFPKTEEGTMVGKALTAKVVAMAPLADDLIKSLLVIPLIFCFILGGLMDGEIEVLHRTKN